MTVELRSRFLEQTHQLSSHLTSLAMFQMLCLALVFIGDVHCNPIHRRDTGINENWIDRTLQYMKSNPETLVELMNMEYALQQGDVVIPMNRNQVGQPWPKVKGIVHVPYLISPEIAGKTDAIESALAWLMHRTCLSFHRRTTEEDYIHFVNGEGCASYVGFIGGTQQLFVGPGCMVGNVCHELLHALGFEHEHTREDRDEHIHIVSHNLMEGTERNFFKAEGRTFGLPYEQRSIMHYGRGYFSANGLPTIVAAEPDSEMGQRNYMTERDTERVRRLYQCDDPDDDGGHRGDATGN